MLRTLALELQEVLRHAAQGKGLSILSSFISRAKSPELQVLGELEEEEPGFPGTGDEASVGKGEFPQRCIVALLLHLLHERADHQLGVQASRDESCRGVHHSSHVVGVMLERLRPHPALLLASCLHRQQLELVGGPRRGAHHNAVLFLRHSQ